MPGFGLDEGRFQFFMFAGGGECRCWRWRISAILSRRFLPRRRGLPARRFEIASDSVTGRQLELLFSAAAGRPDPLFAIFRRGAGRQSFSAQADRAGGRRAAGRARRPRRPAPAAPAAAHLRRLAGRPRPSRLRAGADQRGLAGRLIVKGWCSGYPPGALSRR